MSRTIDLIVHSAAPSKFAVMTEVDGEKVPGMVDCIEVEFVTKQDRHGTLVMRYIGATDIAWAKENLVPGASVSLSIGTMTPPVSKAA